MKNRTATVGKRLKAIQSDGLQTLAKCSHQMSFNPNCTCREGVAVASIRPAPVTGVPRPSNTALLSVGGAKFARFRMLNTSARNWTLAVSEMDRNFVFFTKEKSRFCNPGPISEFRCMWPRRFRQVPGGEAGSQRAWGIDGGVRATLRHPVFM